MALGERAVRVALLECRFPDLDAVAGTQIDLRKDAVLSEAQNWAIDQVRLDEARGGICGVQFLCLVRTAGVVRRAHDLEGERASRGGNGRHEGTCEAEPI